MHGEGGTALCAQVDWRVGGCGEILTFGHPLHKAYPQLQGSAEAERSEAHEKGDAVMQWLYTC